MLNNAQGLQNNYMVNQGQNPVGVYLVFIYRLYFVIYIYIYKAT